MKFRWKKTCAINVNSKTGIERVFYKLYLLSPIKGYTQNTREHVAEVIFSHKKNFSEISFGNTSVSVCPNKTLETSLLILDENRTEGDERKTSKTKMLRCNLEGKPNEYNVEYEDFTIENAKKYSELFVKNEIFLFLTTNNRRKLLFEKI